MVQEDNRSSTAVSSVRGGRFYRCVSQPSRWAETHNLVKLLDIDHLSSETVFDTCHLQLYQIHHGQLSPDPLTSPSVFTTSVLATGLRHLPSSPVLTTCPHHLSSPPVLTTCPRHLSPPPIIFTCLSHLSLSSEQLLCVTHCQPHLPGGIPTARLGGTNTNLSKTQIFAHNLFREDRTSTSTDSVG